MGQGIMIQAIFCSAWSKFYKTEIVSHYWYAKYTELSLFNYLITVTTNLTIMDWWPFTWKDKDILMKNRMNICHVDLLHLFGMRAMLGLLPATCALYHDVWFFDSKLQPLFGSFHIEEGIHHLSFVAYFSYSYCIINESQHSHRQ